MPGVPRDTNLRKPELQERQELQELQAPELFPKRQPIQREAAVADHEQRVEQRPNVIEGVNVDHEHVGFKTWRDRADLFLQPQHLSIGHRGRL